MKNRLNLIVAMSLAAVTSVAAAGEQLVLRDLESKNPKKLSKEELQQLLPGAQMSRISQTGRPQRWSNDPSGNFTISSDNSVVNASPTFASGKWHLSDDGRYCVLFEWKRASTEEWCRYVFQTSDGYYATNSDAVGTERVYKLEIKK